jgi:hypothetical protein
MQEESRSFIEGECLRVAQLQAGCQHLKAVAIARVEPSTENPNWEVLAFNPELPTTARAGAIHAIEEVRAQCRLAPHVTPPSGGRVRGHRKSEG